VKTPSHGRSTRRQARRLAFAAAAFGALLVLGICLQLGGSGAALRDKPKIYCPRVVRTYPHDPAAFTQGLVYANGVLYESTGLEGRSSLRRIDLASGRVERIRELAAPHFAEGLTVLDGKIFQLTWRSQVGFIYDQATFQLLGTFPYAGEGWGLTQDGTRLIISDGSATLYFLDPETYRRVSQVQVRDGSRPVTRLNELEFIEGRVYANVWMTERIAIIDPATGLVEAWLDLHGLLRPEDRRGAEDVLNGIAFDAASGRIWVTGKLWPKLFEIERVPCP